MRFTEALGVERGKLDDWLDPHLTLDTRLSPHPVLRLEAGTDWAQANEGLIAQFVHCYGLVAKATSSSPVSGKAARRLLTFPQPAKVGLGYTLNGTSGSSSGSRIAGTIADGVAVAIAAGLAQPEHIEEISILNEGIGADGAS
jgi:hypothetical protein